MATKFQWSCWCLSIKEPKVSSELNQELWASKQGTPRHPPLFPMGVCVITCFLQGKEYTIILLLRRRRIDTTISKLTTGQKPCKADRTNQAKEPVQKQTIPGKVQDNMANLTQQMYNLRIKANAKLKNPPNTTQWECCRKHIKCKPKTRANIPTENPGQRET